MEALIQDSYQRRGLSVATELVHVGFRNYVAVNRAIAAFSADSVVGKRMIRQAKEQTAVIDMTAGRRARAAIMIDSDHLVLAPANPDVIRKWVAAGRCGDSAQEEPLEKVADAVRGNCCLLDHLPRLREGCRHVLGISLENC